MLLSLSVLRFQLLLLLSDGLLLLKGKLLELLTAEFHVRYLLLQLRSIDRIRVGLYLGLCFYYARRFRGCRWHLMMTDVSATRRYLKLLDLLEELVLHALQSECLPLEGLELGGQVLLLVLRLLDQVPLTLQLFEALIKL